MSKNILKMAGIGLAIVIVLIAVIFFVTRGSQIRLEGSIQQVRVQKMDDKSCVVLVDFRFVNPADYPFIVRDAKVLLEDADGVVMDGMAVAATDMKRLFQYYSSVNPDLGQMYNDVLVMRDRVQPGESMDRMIGARFEIPEEAARNRQRAILRIEDVDGAITEIQESRETN